MSNPATPGVPHEMDAMGAHDDYNGTAWLPRSLYPERSAARKWYCEFTGCPWFAVRVLARWMRHDPENDAAADYDGAFWVECDKDAPGAFQVWRCE